MQLIKRFDFRQKRVIVIGGGLLVLAVGYLIASWLAWNSFSQRLDRADTSWQSSRQSLKGSLISGQQDWAVKYATFKPSIDDVVGLKCQVTPLIGWQAGVIGGLADKQQHCHDIQAQADQASQQLDVIDEYVDELAAVGQILKPLARLPNKMQSSEWPMAIKAWKQAAEQLKSLQLSDEFNIYGADLAEAAQKVARAWQKLVDSDKTQSVQGFDAAKQKLAKAHASFSDQAQQYPHSEGSIFDI